MPIDLRLERGQKVAIIGANGLGKTTLIRSLIGDLPPLSGMVEQGENIRLGYFQQEIKEANYKTCIEEIWEEFPSYTQYEVRAALAKCGLTTKHIESKVMVLSGGEQSKVRLCKILNRETNVLVLDEPTNHLDVQYQHQVLQLLQRLGKTVVCCIHDLNLAARYCNKLLLLNQGELLAYGEPAAVLQPDLLQQVFGLPCDVSVQPHFGWLQVTFFTATEAQQLAAGGARQ